MVDKATLRQRMLAALASQSAADRARRSAVIQEKLFALDAFQRATTVLFYLTITGEVETDRMIAAAQAAGKRVAVPVTDPAARRLELSRFPEEAAAIGPGPHGTREPRAAARRPLAVEALDVVVVPGLAFDQAGHRLGRGLGYYDRFLATVPRHVPRVGLAYHFQLVEALPVAPHDARVTHVVTD